MLPDGGYATPPPRPFDPPPRLCEQGPCRHYHALGILVDAERPKGAGVGEDGRLVGQGEVGPDHVGRHHYCYPDVGIETELGSLPVVECNRWDPCPTNDAARSEARRRYLESDNGQAYLTAVVAWKERQQFANEEMLRDAEDAERVMADAMAARLERAQREARAVRGTVVYSPEGTAPAWLASVESLGVHTQGVTFEDAVAMLLDEVQETVNVPGFTASVLAQFGDLVLIEGNDPSALAACVAKHPMLAVKAAEIQTRSAEPRPEPEVRDDSQADPPGQIENDHDPQGDNQ